MKKLIYATAFGIGYVLGARAGRERYEQIRNAADKVQSDPRVQDAVRKAESFAEDAVHAVADEQKRSDLVDSVKETAQNVRAQATGVAAAVKETAEEVAHDDRVQDAAETAKHAAQDVADSAKDAADGGSVKDVVDTAKHAAQDVGEKAKKAADDGAIEDAVGSVQDTAADVKETAERSASEATQKIKAAADEARGDAADGSGETWPEHPDAHIPEPEDEVVFTTGPDDKN